MFIQTTQSPSIKENFHIIKHPRIKHYQNKTLKILMVKNYLLVAFRHLRKQSAYATLNILGLTIGIVSALLIVLYLSNELGYDKHNDKSNRVYRISSEISEPDNSFRWATTQLPLGRTITSEFGEVESFARFVDAGRIKLEHENLFYFQEGIFLTDSSIFDLFTYDFIAGNPATALDHPNSIVLCESVANKIFKSQNPIGKFLSTETRTYEVTGVYKDISPQSHIRPRGLISINSAPGTNTAQSWGSFSIYTYILLKEDIAPKVVSSKFNQIIDKYVAVVFDQFDVTVRYELINIENIHLYSDFRGEPESLGSIKYIYIFSVVALFLILLASINYMNLSTARSMRRSLEVGIRKVLGAKRDGLIKQFMAESILLTLFSLVISIVLLLIFIPIFNQQLGTQLDIRDLYSLPTLGVILGIFLITSFLSGSYPALYLSAFKPIVVLKGNSVSGSGNKVLRRILVGAQFAFSIFMLLSTLIIYHQMNYLRTADLGFEKDHVVKVELNSAAQREKWPVFKNSLLQNSNITNASSTGSAPGDGFSKNIMKVETNQGSMEDYGIDLFPVDYDYFEALGIKLTSGRNFSLEYATDTASAVIINESMVKRMGWSEPLGKKFQFPQDSSRIFRVIGVVKDYHHRSLYNPIESLLFLPAFNNSSGLITIGQDIPASIAAINDAWNETFLGLPFEYSFLDQGFMDQYQSDQLRGKLFLGFSIMMIFIACLGLLGLASFIAEQRTKEISIRKVLGAEVGSLVTLLIKDFVYLVLAGAIPAFIGGYLFMNDWLQNFEYHVEISPIQFLLVLACILFITIATTGYHALKAASANPSTNLKAE